METLVPINWYVKAGVHIGTKHLTKDMKPFVARIREDGLVIFDINKIDERLRWAGKFLANYDPQDILVVGRRETAITPVQKFAEVTGAKAFPGRYPPGALTNPELDYYIEPEVIIVTDPIIDRNALMDAFKSGITILALCDSNHTKNYIDFCIPGNNRGIKSLALIYWILAREYLRNRGVIPKDGTLKVPVEEFETKITVEE